MNKLSRKLSSKICIGIMVIFFISFLLNNYLLSKYYLHEKKVELSKVVNKLETMEQDKILDSSESIENEYNVTIVWEDLNKDLISLNESLRNKLSNKKITLNKFWITEDVQAKIKEGKKVNKIYNQGKLKSSFLVTFIKKDNMLILMGVSMAQDGDIINIVNKFNLFIIFIALVFIIMIVWIFCNRIIYPLEKLRDVSKDIANLNFAKVEIHTNDEIEELSESINHMSNKLKKAHDDLEEKNENLKIFISNISHELKTPLALIKAYCAGIRDGMDDGAYIGIIEKQTEDMSTLIDNLLKLSKYQNDTVTKSEFDIENLFFNTFEKYKINIENKDISVLIDKKDLKNKIAFADKEKIEIVLNNLISNSIKYTEDKRIQISLKNVGDRILFSMANGIKNHDPKIMEKIWEPFYVIESSRDKKLSGTGLGLSIVRAILQKHNIEHGFNLYENRIEFYMFLEKS